MAHPSGDDSEVFIEQARWLLEWHNRRSEAFTTRAVALLGFVGVVLALLLQGAGLDGVRASSWTWGFLAASLVALLLSGLFAVLTIAPQPIAVPSVAQLRHWWRRHAARPVKGDSAPQIAESFLNSKDLSEVSAVSAAKDDADRRANSFSVAIGTLVAAFLALSLLLCNILNQAW
ncbi:hypothetical protein [Aeromicrobium sp. 179-A 4D2 NHS]|uniref:hypothetical protein n=1 Tax=Aeromicrobium sp. 179-A 4D2 NHS TaxID=3142375 RepID=UPI0039A35160